MSQRTLAQRVAELERQVALLSANSRPAEGGMTGAELVAYMKVHGEELRPIFEEAMKLRERDREKARRRFAREETRAAAKKRNALCQPTRLRQSPLPARRKLAPTLTPAQH